MLSSCSGRLISGGGGGGGGGNSSLSSSSSTSAQRHASQAELLASSSSTSSCCNSNETSFDNGSSRNLPPHGQLGHNWPSSRHSAQEQLKLQQQQSDLAGRDEFISVNGAIFTLSNNRPQPRPITSSYLLADDVDIARREDPRAPLPPPPPLPEANCSAPKPLNRQHQYRPIHQQLQRIYGNKLQEFEQINRQQQKLTTSTTSNSNRQAATQASGMVKQLEHVFAPADGRARGQQRSHLLNQQQQSAIYNLSDSRAYDSLNEQSMVPTEPPEVRHTADCRVYGQHQQKHVEQRDHAYQQDVYNLDRRLPPVNAKPLPPNSMQAGDDRLARARPTRNSYERAQHETYVDEDEEDDDEEEDRDEADCDRPVLAENDCEEQDLLLGDAGRIDRHTSRLLINNRKKQMESLHYATATAAALLNVTASAAAAFVVSDKNLINSKPRQQQQHHLRPQRSAPQPAQKHRPQHSKTIATGAKLRQEAKQHLELGPGGQKNIGQYQQLYEFGGDQLRQQRSQMQQVSVSAMRSGLDQQPVYQIRAEQLAPIYQHRQQQLQLQQQRNCVGALKSSHQAGPRAPTRPPQPAKPQHQQQNAPRLAGGPLTQQQMDLLRRYKQQSQLGNSQQAELARSNRNTTTYNNLISSKQAAAPAAQVAILQAPDKQSDAILMAHLAAKYQQQQQQILASAVDPRLLMLATGQIPGASAVAKLREELQQRHKQQMTYGLLVAAKGDKRRPVQPIYAHAPLQLKAHPEHRQAPLRQSQYQIGAITNNSSGRSDAPLILNRSVVKADKPSGLLDKISHINLTVLWWVLLAISVLFITVVIGITRYLV